MATDPKRLEYYVSLREALVSVCDDKSAIKVFAKDALIDWGDVDPDGSARAAWDDVIRNARKQRRLRQLIEATSRRYDSLLRSLLEYEPSDEGFVEPSRNSSSWPPLAHHEIDRGEQLDPLHQSVLRSSGRPLVAIWCGDDLARHDILKRRIKALPLVIVRRGLNPLFKDCQFTTDVSADLRRSCFDFLGRVPKDDSNSLEPLLIGKDFSEHLLSLIVDLTWDGTTSQQLLQILDWCQKIGPIADDRRFVVAVAIQVEVPRKGLSRLWSLVQGRTRESDVLEAHRQLNRIVNKHEAAILLPPLSDVRLNHLFDWRSKMEELYGYRPDDLLADPNLVQIVPREETRPMHDVVTAFETIFKSNKA